MATLYVDSGYVADRYTLDDIFIDWKNKIIQVPKVFMTLVQSVPTVIYQMDLNDFRLRLKDLEDDPEGMPFLDTHQHNTTVNVGGVELARVIEIINGYTVTFEDDQYAVNLIGANSNVGDVVNVNQVSVRSANSAGLVTSQAIEYGEYEGGVHIDKINGVSGTTYPTGTNRRPVNNVPDARLIAEARGFNELHVIGNITFDTGDNVENFVILGQNAAQTQITVNAGAETLNCEIKEAYVTGNLDGGTILRDCVIADLNYINGFVHQCMINPGTITLGGTTTAHFLSCYSGVPGSGTPIIDMNGTTNDQDTPLAMRDYNGGIKLVQKTGSGAVSIDLSSGQVILDSTVTAGQIVVRGVGQLDDNSTADVNRAGLISQESIDDIKYLVETLRPHHTGLGNVIYWDPTAGNDASNGSSIARSVATFARAHDLAADGQHDIIVAVSSSIGQTIVDEHLHITKRYLFVRGPGRDFRIKPTTATAATIKIDAEGVELSGMVVDTADFGGQNAIEVLPNADFFFLDSLWSRDAQDDTIDVVGPNVYGRINNCFFSHPGDVGIELDGDVRHVKITNTELDACGGDGIRMEGVTVRNNIVGAGTKIYDSGGYGINIQSPGKRNVIDADVAIYDNALGDVFDGGTLTEYQAQDNNINIATQVWSEQVADHNVTGSFGNFVQKKILTVTKFLGLK